jgi:tetratricopeptide (TPR) repeat protein
LPRLHARQQIDRCRQAEGKIGVLWSATRQSELQAALLQAQLDNAWPAVKAALDRWAHDWTRLHGETCTLGVRPDAESQSLFDLRMECLNQRWQETSETLTLLTTQPKTVKHATKAVASLQALDSCADGEALRRPLRSTATPAALRPINEGLARARADFAVENCRESLAEAIRVAEDARALGAVAPAAEARTLTGVSQICMGDRDAARVSFMDTAVLAEQAQDSQLVVRTYLRLISLAVDMAQYDDAQHWLQLARETMTSHRASVKLQAEMEYQECYVPYARGRLAEAEPHCRRSRELYRQLPTRTATEADAVEMLGQVLGREGKFVDASEAYQEARRLFRLANGPDSTDEIRVLEGLADDEAEQDHMATALALQQRVVEHGTHAFPDQLCIHLSFYGYLLVETGRARESVPVFERALAMAERIKSEHPFETGTARAGLGSAYVTLGQPQLALGYLEEARRITPVEGNEDVIAQLDIDLAKALWGATPHRARAIGLARQARDFLRAHPLGALRARHTREVEAWLAQHEKMI